MNKIESKVMLQYIQFLTKWKHHLPFLELHFLATSSTMHCLPPFAPAPSASYTGLRILTGEFFMATYGSAADNFLSQPLASKYTYIYDTIAGSQGGRVEGEYISYYS